MATISKSGISNGNTISATHITNIIDALDGTTANNLVFAGPVTGSAPISASAGFTGSLMGTASWATNATTAASANSVAFSSITSLPASLSGSGGFGGVSAVGSTLTSVSYTASVDFGGITNNGAFFPIDAQSGAVNILLDDLGGSNKIGTEFVFFAIDATNDITFSSVTGTTTIICSGSISNPKIAGTGLAVVAKFIERGGVPYKWAVIGGIKA